MLGRAWVIVNRALILAFSQEGEGTSPKPAYLGIFTGTKRNSPLTLALFRRAREQKQAHAMCRYVWSQGVGWAFGFWAR